MKSFLIGIFLLCALSLSGQNIQFLTSIERHIATFEIYKTLDKVTLDYFTDFKMSKNGYSEAYSEICVYYNLNNIVSPTIQYNAGLNRDFYIQPVYLLGLSKSFVIKESFNLSFDLMYRYQKELIFENEVHNGYQLTTKFSQDFDKIQYSGYCDFWNLRYYIFEPQGWYKFSKRFYAGLELRISNYSPMDDYQNYLMLGLKWNIN